MTQLQLKIDSVIGPLYLVGSEKSLHGVFWKKQNIPMVNGESPAVLQLLQKATTQLAEYFSGERKKFSIPLEAEGTPFQKKVWQALSEIPYGETRSYKELAIAINQPKACRAVGAANGKNPLSIIVPCHRVIAADRSLGGFAGGLAIKKKLLDLEK